MHLRSIALTAAGASLADALVSPDGTGRLPALGWNSWNEYGCNINEEVFLTVADRMVKLGLKDAGYEYVNIDDCWSDQAKRRDKATGRIIVDSNKFPNGISHLADQIHAKGLKLGIYGDAGSSTCGGYAGSLGYEAIDAAMWAEWGIDCKRNSFCTPRNLKYDNCNIPQEWVDVPYMYPDDGGRIEGDVPSGYDWSMSNSTKRFNQMRDALLEQNRTIEYSLCIWGHANVATWGNGTGHSWRMYSDIYPKWSGIDRHQVGVMQILNQAAFYWNVTDFWGHNDWDMLEVGNGDLTFEENRSHFALWAALKSPLIIGTKLDTISDEVLGILKNEELIAFNQDPVYGKGAIPYLWDGVSNDTHPANYWAGSSSKGMHAFVLNTFEDEMDMEVVFGDIPGLKGKESQNFLVHDMWTGKDIGEFKKSVTVTVKRHDTAALRITEVDGKHPNHKWRLQQQG